MRAREGGRPDAQTVQVAGTKALEHDVGVVGQSEQQLAAVLVLDVEGDALLAPVQKSERKAEFGIDLVVLEGAEVTHRVTSRRLDLDDTHPEVGQDPSDELALLIGEIEGAEAVKHPHGAGLSPRGRRT